jgi:hypothetical protein
MLYPIVLRCADPLDQEAIRALDPTIDPAALEAGIAAGRHLVAEHGGRLVAGAVWMPGGRGEGARVDLTFVDRAVVDGEAVERLLWYARSAALFAGFHAEAASAPAVERASLAVVVAEAARADSARHLAA